MEIGFTGTQQGMTEDQKIAVASLLDVLCEDGGHVHHGDCIGADAQFHELARSRGLRIELHPPIKADKRAFCAGADIKWPKYDYLKRNQHIVNSVKALIATPSQETEVKRSGTWFTVRRARQARIKIYLILPNGHIKEEG